jgi:hypothetical protein
MINCFQECDDMSTQNVQLQELLQNFIMSSKMEGVIVDETLQSMCLSVLNGKRTLDECLAQIGAKYAQGS